MKLKSVSIIFAATLSATLPVQAADLIAVYRDALSQDPIFASARAAYEAAKEASPQARAATLPSINLSGSVNRVNSENEFNGVASSRDYTSKGYSLSLTQPLFRMQTWITVDQAGLQVKQAEAVLADARQNIVTRSAQAYFDLLLAQALELNPEAVDQRRMLREIGEGIPGAAAERLAKAKAIVKQLLEKPIEVVFESPIRY